MRAHVEKWKSLSETSPKSEYNSKVTKFELDEDPLQRQVYFLPFTNSLKMVLSQFSENYMLLMNYTFIREEDFPDYAKKATCNLLHTYIDAHSKILIYEYIGDGVQAISRMQSQCANMNFSDQSRYNIMFCQVVQKGG